MTLWRRIRTQRTLLLMAAPAVLAYLLFSYFPLFGWIMAFIDYRPGRSLFGSEFVGLKNFITFFKDSQNALNVVRNTLCINLLSLAAVFICALLFAIMLSEVPFKRFSRGVQMVSLFPFFLSWIIAYSLMYALFGLETGAVNVVLMNLGAIDEGINVLGDPKYSWALMTLLSVWKSLGYYSIIFLSTIVGIPREEYEAASIDGASRLQKILYITLPNLKQVFFVMLILQSGYLLTSNLEQFFAFTNSQNWDTMVVFDMYVYKFGLGRSDFSYATAVGMMRTLVSLVLLFSVNRLSKKFAEQSVF